MPIFETNHWVQNSISIRIAHSEIDLFVSLIDESKRLWNMQNTKPIEFSILDIKFTALLIFSIDFDFCCEGRWYDLSSDFVPPPNAPRQYRAKINYQPPSREI